VLSQELPEGRLPQPQVLFKRIEDALIEAEESKLKAFLKT